jgi:hypothetical protein
MGHREIVMQRTGAVRKTSAPMTALHLMIGALGFGLRMRKFSGKTASTRRQMISKKGARKRPFRSFANAAFAAF